MKNLYLTIIMMIVSTFAFAQYGPIPYRSVHQTVGEEYVVLPDEDAKTSGFSIYKGEDPSTKKNISYKEGKDKILKLVSLFEANGFYGKGTYGKFTDNSGEYFMAAVSKDKFVGIALKSDYELARKALINKTLWLKSNPTIKDEKGWSINVYKSDSVTVTDVQLSNYSRYPHRLTVKSNTGKIGFINVNAGGSPDNYDSQEFYNMFYEESPKVTAAKEAAVKEAAAKERMAAEAAIKAAEAKKEEELRNNPCILIEYKYDKFEQEKNYSTSTIHTFKCSFEKYITKAGVVSYYISLRTIGQNALATKQGVVILLKNGKRINKPKADVETNVNSHAEFVRTAFITLMPADIALLKASPIEGFQLYIDNDAPEDPEMLHKLFQCLITKK